MKILSINDSGTYQAIEIPDIKIYKISELANCTIPPMLVLFNHELFLFRGFDDEFTYWRYCGCGYGNGELLYDFTNHKLISCTNSIEQMRQKFHEGTSSGSGSGSGSGSSSEK